MLGRINNVQLKYLFIYNGASSYDFPCIKNKLVQPIHNLALDQNFRTTYPVEQVLNFSQMIKQINRFSTEKLENSIYEVPIITQTLNINNLRTTSAKSINLNTIRKLVEYSLKNIGKDIVYSLPFLDIPVQRQVGIVTCPAGQREQKC